MMRLLYRLRHGEAVRWLFLQAYIEWAWGDVCEAVKRGFAAPYE
jgi:hypothetical protein